MKIPFVGPSYVYRSVNFDSQRAINCYPAKSKTGTSKSQFIMCPTPGKTEYLTLPLQPIRGFYITSAGRAFAVAYDMLYEVLEDSEYTPRGQISTYTGNVSMSDNGLELIIVDGSPDGWILDLSSGTFTQIDTSGAGVGFLGAVTVCFIGGYFLCNEPDSGIYFISNIYDGLTWDALDFANAEGSPDNLVAVVNVHQQVALIGSNTVEFLVDTGASPFPLEVVQGVFLEYGCTAPFSVQQSANTIFWVGSDKSGANIVWMADGYQPRRISTEAIEAYLSRYDTSNTSSYSYQEDGHYFYVLNISGAPTTLVYDITIDQWHERGFWNVNVGAYQADRALFHVFAFGKHLVSDRETGVIYEQSLNYTQDNGNLIRRQRTMPYFYDDLEYLYFSFFQIDMQTGVGTNTGSNENVNPQAILDWSDDGGHSWSNEIYTSIGALGDYIARVIFRRLGRSRQRVFRVTIMADIPVYMIAAHIKVEKGLA